MNPAYILSTNYEKLYELIEAGHTVAGFVTTESYTNDIVQIRNNGVGDLQICARGIIYGEVPNYWKDYQPEASEIGLFKASCQSLRLQYIVPNAGQVEELVTGLKLARNMISLNAISFYTEKKIPQQQAIEWAAEALKENASYAEIESLIEKYT